MKDTGTVTVLIATETGSNYESKELNGISHFLEHMCFKGTPKRPKSVIVSSEFDKLGAEHNAFTSNELTAYYAKGTKKNFRELLDLLSDMYLNSSFPKEDLEIEKGVILQEINRIEDEPSKKVQRLISLAMYGDTPAGRSTLGLPENIHSFTREDFVNYRKKHYVAEGTIVIVAGDITNAEVVKEVKKYLSKIPTGKKGKKDKVIERQIKPNLLISKKNADLIQLMFGFRGYKANDKRNVPLEVLNTILGSGLSSRLFQKLRTDLGICYTVGSAVVGETDHGSLWIGAGLAKDRLEEGIKAILNECKKLKENLVTEEELNKAKGYMLGHLYLGLETSDSLAMFYMEQEIVKSKLETPQEIEKQIKNVTAKDIQKVAMDIFQNEKMNLALVGEVEEKDKILKTLRF